MKTIYYFISFLFCFVMFSSCADDETIEPKKIESKDFVSLVYEGKEFEFKNLHYGKYTNENRELIGFFVEGEIVIDDQHKNRILLYFKTDFEHIVEFAGIEFIPFKPVSPGGTVVGYSYHYITDKYGNPFNIDLMIENGRITGTFEGDLHRGIDYTLESIHLSSGKIDIEAKTTND